MKKNNIIQIIIAFSSLTAFAQPAQEWIVSDLTTLKSLNIAPEVVDQAQALAIAQVNSFEKGLLIKAAHAVNKCGGFQVFDSKADAEKSLKQLHGFVKRSLSLAPMSPFTVMAKSEVAAALLLVNPQNLKTTVQWMSSFKTRTYDSKKANDSVDQFFAKIQEVAKNYKFPYTLEFINHKKIGQKSIRMHLTGSQKPEEIVVVGGHLDSINQMNVFGEMFSAPGADDNASGSANLLEALRVYIEQNKQPSRTVEIFWYAGEEGGLLGSAEIAKSYKDQNKNVVGVLQLDMTLFPGSGEFTLGSMTDYTTPQLRQYLSDINSTYLNARIVEDKCGYGCSDHASWFNQGYPTIMPFESDFNRMNQNLHTEKDVIDINSNFNHSAMFSKIALLFMMDLAEQ